MDKKSEQRKDAKCLGDIDVGVRDYGAGGKNAQLAGLWSIAPEEVVGLSPTRIMTNCYTKQDGWKQKYGSEKEEKPDLLDQIIEHGPPLLNTSKPRRVF